MPPTRDRKSAEGLLPRMEAIPGKKRTLYRYHPLGGAKPVSLGHDRLAACRQVLDMLGEAPDHGTVKWVWEKYQESKRFTRLADATKADYRQCAVPILACFGHRRLAGIDAPMIAYYVREHRKDAEVRANREKSLLSNLFAHGIDLGVCKENPAWPQVDRAAGEIRIKRAKQRGKKRGEVIELIAISPALENCLDRLAKIRPARDCLYVFPTRDNNAYTSAGFKTLWQRVVLAAIAAKVISAETRFTFHDLRAHYVTVHKADTGKLPDMHKNPETTARVYDRNKIVRRTSN